MAKTKPVSKREEMRARAIVQRAMNQEKERELAERRKLIGRCFKYPNSYSGGERWWLYAVVTGVDDYGRIAATQFQHDHNGTVTAGNEQYPGLLPHGGWIEISRGELVAGCIEVACAFLRKMEIATHADAVDPQAASTGNPSTREK